MGFDFVRLNWHCCEVATAGEEHEDGELFFMKILPSCRKSPTLCQVDCNIILYHTSVVLK